MCQQCFAGFYEQLTPTRSCQKFSKQICLWNLAQGILTETVETETRYRTETRTGTTTYTDPDTGETVTEEYEYEVQVPYTYYICTVELENFNLSHVPVYIMSHDQLSMYATYMSTLGNRPDLFPSSSYVDAYYHGIDE